MREKTSTEDITLSMKSQAHTKSYNADKLGWFVDEVTKAFMGNL